MNKKRDVSEILLDIKKGNLDFDKEEFLEYVKYDVINLYDNLKENNQDNIKNNYDNNLIQKLIEEKEKYKIKATVDHVSIQYKELYEYFKDDNDKYIQVYLSLYIYDDTENNFNNQSEIDKYWNEIWVVTYKNVELSQENNCNCDNCGAVMVFDKKTKMFKCSYCGNMINNTQKWKLCDIEVQ